MRNNAVRSGILGFVLWILLRDCVIPFKNFVLLESKNEGVAR